MRPQETQRLNQILDATAGLPVLVFGDLILDEFIWGQVNRISPEAPVPIVQVERETVTLGGAANVAANLATLGARPWLVGVIGNDRSGEQFVSKLQQAGIPEEGVLATDKRQTTLKTRIIAHQQQVCRTDRESHSPLDRGISARLLETALNLIPQVSAVILSDYSKGVLSEGSCRAVIDCCREEGKFVSVDPKVRNFAYYRGASIVTPNRKEAEQVVSLPIRDQASLLRAGEALLRSIESQAILITRGEEGMSLFSATGPVHIPTVAREVYDVTGAGDTVVAMFTLAMAAGADLEDAAFLANHAAGVVVGKIGTARVGLGEVRTSLGT